MDIRGLSSEPAPRTHEIPYLATMTWPQAADALKSLKWAIIPVGAGCKEHGLHLPLNTDWLMAEYLARRVAEQVSALVLPTIQYGYYPAFLEYAGSISIGQTSFADMIADTCRSLAHHGAGRFFILNTGISTISPLTAARTLLASESIRMDFCDLRNLATAERVAIQQQSHGTHADEIETSMMLYIAPEVVHLDLASPELAPASPGPLTRKPGGPGVYSATGSWGDPTLATRAKGQIIVEAIVRELVQALES